MAKEGKEYGRLRFLYTGWAILETMLFGGIINGWASLVFVLKEDGLYRSLCASPTSGVTDINVTVESSALPEDNTACTEQDTRLNLWFTIASAFRNIFGIIVGLHIFKFGTRSARLLGWLSFIAGSLMMAFASDDVPWILLPSLMTLTYGGLTLLLTNVQVSCLFPRYAGVIITLVSGGFDFSASTQLAVKLLHEAGMLSRLYSYVGLCGLHVVMVLTSTLCFMPKTMFLTPPPEDAAPKDVISKGRRDRRESLFDMSEVHVNVHARRRLSSFGASIREFLEGRDHGEKEYQCNCTTLPGRIGSADKEAEGGLEKKIVETNGFLKKQTEHFGKKENNGDVAAKGQAREAPRGSGEADSFAQDLSRPRAFSDGHSTEDALKPALRHLNRYQKASRTRANTTTSVPWDEKALSTNGGWNGNRGTFISTISVISEPNSPRVELDQPSKLEYITESCHYCKHSLSNSEPHKPTKADENRNVATTIADVLATGDRSMFETQSNGSWKPPNFKARFEPQENGKDAENLSRTSVTIANEESKGPERSLDSDFDQTGKTDAEKLFPSLKSCLTYVSFWLHVFWMSCNVLRLVAFFGQINRKLTHMFDSDKVKVSYYTNIQAYCILAIMAVSWVSGALHDWQTHVFKERESLFQRLVLPSALPLALTSFLGVAITILLMIDSVAALFAIFILHVFYNAFIFGVCISFLLKVFPIRYFGILNGVLSIIVGAFCFIQYGIFRWHDAYQDGPLHADLFILSLGLSSLLHPIYIVIKATCCQPE